MRDALGQCNLMKHFIYKIKGQNKKEPDFIISLLRRLAPCTPVSNAINKTMGSGQTSSPGNGTWGSNHGRKWKSPPNPKCNRVKLNPRIRGEEPFFKVVVAAKNKPKDLIVTILGIEAEGNSDGVMDLRFGNGFGFGEREIASKRRVVDDEGEAPKANGSPGAEVDEAVADRIDGRMAREGGGGTFEEVNVRLSSGRVGREQ
jgi:hypothetical protein